MKLASSSSALRAFWQKHGARVLALAFAVGITAAILAYREQLAALRGYGYLGIFLTSVLSTRRVLLR